MNKKVIIGILDVLKYAITFAIGLLGGNYLS